MKTLKYIAFSYKNTSTGLFSELACNFSETNHFVDLITNRYSDIAGILVLSTCSRIEIYFESVNTKSLDVLNELGIYTKINKLYSAELSDSTSDTAFRLLNIASGLDSPIAGDKQIYYQVKSAFLNAINHNFQGTLLERLMQNVNQLHKRVVNTTNYYASTNSYGHLSLKMAKRFINDNKLDGNVLLIGAGKMINEVAQYLKKTGVSNVKISNRNVLKAKQLADKYGLNVEEYESILNKLDLFDVVITAVSNQENIIDPAHITNDQKQLFIDLGSPGNVNLNIGSIENKSLVDLRYFNNNIADNRMIAEGELIKVHEAVNFQQYRFMEWIRQYQSGKHLKMLKVKSTIN